MRTSSDTRRPLAAAALPWLAAALIACAVPVRAHDGPHTIPDADEPAVAETSMDDPDSGAGMIGQPAPEWDFVRWLRSKPMTLESVRGKVVLMRWWTEGCHYCRATLPVVERARREHPGELVTVGVFHPKPPREVGDKRILKVAKDLGYDGPIAVDTEWKGLDAYWLDGHPERNWTSVSFLIDREGKVRWVHGGGEFHPSGDPRHARCDLQNDEFEAVLKELLAERPQVP